LEKRTVSDPILATIERERKRRRIGLDKLETFSGVSKTTYIRWRTGTRQPSLANAVAIAGAVGLELQVVAA
jgi:transcriptional regulator with XRE-family HTH domain